MKAIIAQYLNVVFLKSLLSVKAQDIKIRPVQITVMGKSYVISMHAFLQGILALVCIYLCVFFILVVRGDQTIQYLSASLDSRSLPVVSEQEVLEERRRMEAKIDAHRRDLQAMKDSGELKSLEPAPIDGLFIRGPYGRAPQMDVEERLTPFEAYKRPFFNAAGLPIISLLMKDYGISSRISEQALKVLPANVSLLLSVYAPEPERFQELARADGHELWLTLPMETSAYPNSDPGPQALLSRMSQRYNMDQLSWILSRTTGYTGVVTESDDIFNNAEPMFRSLIREIYDSGLGVFEMSVVDPSPVIPKTANQLQTPYLKADIDLDDSRWSGNRDQAFELLETVASGKGHAVAVFHPYPENLVAVDVWLRNLEQRGFKLAPLSAAVGPFNLSSNMLETIRLKQEQDRMNADLPLPVVVQGLPPELPGDDQAP